MHAHDFSHPHWIVIADPERTLRSGAVVSETLARALHGRGGHALPYEPDLARASGVGGYFGRAYGDGLAMPTTPAYVAPMTAFCSREYTRLHWLAALALEEKLADKVVSGEKAQGFVRFVADGNQVNPVRLGVVQNDEAIQLDKLGRVEVVDDGLEGWVVGGQVRATVPGDGHYGFALYGFAPGVRVHWAAMTQTR